MKKYYPIDFDEKGNAILGTARTTPTSNGFVPTTWAPPAPSVDGNGIRSITISPSMTTTPALDSFMPISYDDGHSNRIYVETVGAKPGETISFIVTPTSGWKIGVVYDESPEYGEVGEPYTITAECIDYEEGGTVVGWDAENNIYAANEDETETFAITLHVAGSLQ